MRYRDLIERKDLGNSKTCVGNQRGIYPEEIACGELEKLDPKVMNRKKKLAMSDDENDKARLAKMPTVVVSHGQK